MSRAPRRPAESVPPAPARRPGDLFVDERAAIRAYARQRAAGWEILRDREARGARRALHAAPWILSALLAAAAAFGVVPCPWTAVAAPWGLYSALAFFAPGWFRRR